MSKQRELQDYVLEGEACKVWYDDGDLRVGGWAVEAMESPLTGKVRLRVVDFLSEANDEEAGKWVYASQCHDLS